MQRIFLFLATNIAILTVFGAAARLPGGQAKACPNLQ